MFVESLDTTSQFGEDIEDYFEKNELVIEHSQTYTEYLKQVFV